jgi:hypothetical protein
MLLLLLLLLLFVFTVVFRVGALFTKKVLCVYYCRIGVIYFDIRINPTFQSSDSNLLHYKLLVCSRQVALSSQLIKWSKTASNIPFSRAELE